MHKTGIIPKASPFGSGSHHGLSVFRFIPHPSLLCFGRHGGEGSTGSLCSVSAGVLQGFPLRNERPERREKREYFPLPSLPLVSPQQWLHHLLGVSILCGFRIHQASPGPELGYYHFLLSSLQSRGVASCCY